jgi:septal ring factor EnvC (AmiA/AmiB activator)
MKDRFLIFWVAFFCACWMVAGSADLSYAQRQSSIRERIEQQQVRIEDGIRSGSLTRKEAAKVQKELDEVRRARAKMHDDDGRISHKERERLNNRLDKVERLISREKHDSQKR